jgi:hypothetical protein
MLQQKTKYALIAILLLIAAFQALQQERSSKPEQSTETAGTAAPLRSDGSEILRAAFEQRRSDVQVEGRGTVERVLPDDNDGSRHQRFILRLAHGQTVLVAHNIDLAPRIEGLRAGDEVRFYGEYEWNPQGGVLHWTHHDPKGIHPGGWLEHRGKRYQ